MSGMNKPDTPMSMRSPRSVDPVRAAAKQPAWAEELFDLFASMRESLRDYAEADVNAALDEAVRQSRAERAGPE